MIASKVLLSLAETACTKSSCLIVLTKFSLPVCEKLMSGCQAAVKKSMPTCIFSGQHQE